LRRHQFERYLDKVFDFSARVTALPDGRQFPQHSGKKVFDAVFLGAACQFPALHRIETECRQGALCKRIGAVSEDTMGYALARYDLDALLALSCAVARQCKRNGLFRSQWARGRIVAAVDGFEICSSFVRSCEDCMERKIQHLVDGELREQVQYYHRISVVAVVSSAFPIPLGIRFQKSGESEVACSLALLEELVQKMGRRFLDLLVADALYLQAPFIAAVEALGFDWVINLKENQPELLTEARRLLPGEEPAAPLGLQLWHAPDVYWPASNRSVRVVKTVRRIENRRQLVRRDELGRKRTVKESIVEASTNFYASNLQLGSIPPSFIHQLGRSRWIIDSEVLQTMTNAGHLKKPSVHQGRGQALRVLTCIRLLAFTLTLVFFHRQVRSHFRNCSLGLGDVARRLAYQFLLLRADSG
jgi:hypothetical protein